MQRPIIDIPPDFAGKLNMNWDIEWRGQSAGDTNLGVTRTTYNAFPRWVGEPAMVLVHSEIAKWRALRARAQGLVGIYRVRILDPVAAIDYAAGTPAPIPFDGDIWFDDGTGFENDLAAFAVKAANPGATTIRLYCETPGGPPNIGQIMSHDDWPFMVTAVRQVGTWIFDCDIQMPLRSTIRYGDLVYWEGRGLFEAAEEGMGNPTYAASRVSQVSLSFREVLNR
ncbi:MAG: hypothetical protein KDE03_17540 [Rhodobacteraceae bacterium]|nr:hypothetical protein [Paracoccaceae bacterium]